MLNWNGFILILGVYIPANSYVDEQKQKISKTVWFTADLREFRQVPLQRNHPSFGRIFPADKRRRMTCNATEPAFMSA